MTSFQRVLPLAAVCLTAGLASAQDECATAVPAVIGATPFATNAGATPSAEPWTCVSGAAPDVWFTYTAAANFGLTVDLCGSGYDTALSLYDGSCGALNLLGCNDDSCGLQSGISITPVAGTTYFIRIGGFSTASGAGTLNIAEALTAPNDDCGGAIAVGAGATAFNTTGATLSADPWTCASSTSPDLWYSFVAGGGLDLTVDLCGSTYDTALSLYDGSCGALNLLACNDDTCGLASSVSVVPVAGATYFIRVGGFGSTSAGAGTLNVTESFAPANDDCVGAIAIGLGSTVTTTLGATTSPEPWPCSATTNFNHGNDLWFTYTPSVAGDFTISTCNPGTAFDTVLEVFTGACGALTSVACNDDVPCGFGSFRSAATIPCSVAGTTYTFRVGAYGALAAGALEISIDGAGSNCVQTIYAGANGGSVGGAVYFDATFSQDVVLGGLQTNYDVAVGSPVGVLVYVTPGTSVGVETNAAAWTLVASGDGTAAGFNVPTDITFSAPLLVPAGSYGVALVSVGDGHRYTNGNGANQNFASADGVITLSLGKATNIPFTGTPFSPRVWNGGFCYDVNIGNQYCTSNPNSTGSVGQLIVGGQDCASVDSLVLTATNLPQNSFAFFLCSTTPGSSNPPGSQGVLCLGGDIGRGVGGSILNTGTVGAVRATSNLTLPHPSLGTVQVMAGDTWHYQCWHRDSVGGSATSNLTNAASVTYH